MYSKEVIAATRRDQGPTDEGNSHLLFRVTCYNYTPKDPANQLTYLEVGKFNKQGSGINSSRIQLNTALVPVSLLPRFMYAQSTSVRSRT